MPEIDLWSRPRSAQDLGGFVAELRRRRGLTQEELASRLNVSRRFVYELESGKSTLYLERIFAALNQLDATLEVRAGAPRTDPVTGELPDPDLDW